MLDELLDEYKETMNINLIKEFTDMLWNSKYTLKKHKKFYKYKINEYELKEREDLISLFDKYNYIELTFCKSYYKKRLSYIDYIRVHVNNMYAFLVDKSVYLPKKYYQLLLTPKKEYYRVVESLKNGEIVQCEDVKANIENALTEAEQIKLSAIEKKIELKWKDYKKLINTYIERIFNNYLSPTEYEKKYGWNMDVNVDGWSENNYVIKYICKSLTGYMRNYLKANIIKEKACVICGIDISNKRSNKYCGKQCWKVGRRTINQRYYAKNKD